MGVLTFTLLGLLIGSFANVVIHRLPRGASVVWPRSACPSCGHTLSAWELIPVVSHLVLRGRCRHCGAAISRRYPFVELVTALGFGVVASVWPPTVVPVASVALAGWWTLLVIITFIDLQHHEIPDVLTLPGTVVMLLAAWAWGNPEGLPLLRDALVGALAGAGLLVFVNRLGALALRRFRDTEERLWPIGFDAVNLAALVGAIGGFTWGVGSIAASVAVNLVSRRSIRLPEPVLWAAWLAALMAAPIGVGVLNAVTGSVLAAGMAALVGAVAWWIVDLRTGGEASEGEEPAPGSDEPVAMGFGDVKLAALLGVVLGWERLLVAVFLAVLLGAVVGVVARLRGGGRILPFGPFLAVAGAVTLLVGDAILRAYLTALGVG